MSDVIEIRDPEIDQEAIRRRVQAQIAQRLAAGGYGPDPATLGPRSLRQLGTEKPGAWPIEFPGLNQALIELIADSSLHEPTFTSSVPLVGPAIVIVRRLWNWMSTKWYVRPLIWQQSTINERISAIISKVAQWQEIDAQRLAELEARVGELEARLAEWESR
jgi:hypothetical protein